jgi:hypothetical protein
MKQLGENYIQSLPREEEMLSYRRGSGLMWHAHPARDYQLRSSDQN